MGQSGVAGDGDYGNESIGPAAELTVMRTDQGQSMTPRMAGTSESAAFLPTAPVLVRRARRRGAGQACKCAGHQIGSLMTLVERKGIEPGAGVVLRHSTIDDTSASTTGS